MSRLLSRRAHLELWLWAALSAHRVALATNCPVGRCSARSTCTSLYRADLFGRPSALCICTAFYMADPFGRPRASDRLCQCRRLALASPGRGSACRLQPLSVTILSAAALPTVILPILNQGRDARIRDRRVGQKDVGQRVTNMNHGRGSSLDHLCG